MLGTIVVKLEFLTTKGQYTLPNKYSNDFTAVRPHFHMRTVTFCGGRWELQVRSDRGV